MEEVREAIGIDKVDMSGNFIFIEEQHNADANFVLHAITSHCRDTNKIVCFALFHNTFGHFHNVGMKLGYNLRKELNSSVRIVEPLKIISKNIHRENKAYAAPQVTDNKLPEFDIKNKSSHLVKQLAQIIKDECISIKKGLINQKVYLIIDDLSHLFDFGLSFQDIWLFIRYLRSFVNFEPHLTFCIASHVYKAAQEVCHPNITAICLRHFADLVINVQPLETGFSKNVSGKMIVNWKSQQQRLKFKWSEEMIYLFKLLDRQVKLFAPGSSHIM
ncbi:elongator complex protein 6 [Nasonia vitripennis]|uniref:Elongator complex protein 6 n=1 Tax=Nasonia vitripennis TaxID=7425 RepID=A0A7M7T9R7_NASVI|nr:elongator complex protein 6 [Nasonia vitripennis]